MSGAEIIPPLKPSRHPWGVWRPLGGVSLALNVALAGWWAFGTRSAHREPGRTLGSPVHTRSVRAVSTPARPPNGSTITTNLLAFRWSMLEADDYRVYIANLRAVGCPEPILRDLIAAELNALYRRRSRDLPEPPFWTAGAARAQAYRDRHRADHALEAEKRAVYRELLGVDWPGEEPGGTLELALTELFLGFIPEDRRSGFLTSIQERDAAADAIREAADSILLPADRAALQALYERWFTTLTGRFSPTELAEIRLRMGIMSMHNLDEKDFDGLELTGREFRELTRIYQGGADLLRDEFVDRNGLREPAGAPRPSGLDADQQAEVRQLLGDSRAAAYDRNRDPQYREARDFVEEHKLPASVAGQVYAVRRELDAAAAEVRAETSLTPEDRAARLAAMAADASDAIGRLLGPEAAQAGADQVRAWLAPVQKAPR